MDRLILTDGQHFVELSDVGGQRALKVDVLQTVGATEATAAAIKTNTDRIPASPATDRASAAAPMAARLSDGAAFYKPTTPADTQPVSGPLTDAQLRAVAVPVSGTVTANAGTGTFAVSGPLTDTQLRATAVPVSGPLTDAQMRATAVPVSGTVTANAGTGTFAVSGPLTDTQLRAAAVPVSGPLTDTQLRAAAVPVSGPLTDTQLRAAAVPVSQSGTWTVQPGNTQNSTPWLVLDPHNTGRVHVNLYAVAVAAGASGAETAITLTKSAGTGATSAAVSHAITNGKKFRIMQIAVATRGHATATAQATTFNLRLNTAGAVTTTSTPVLLALRCATPATASAWDRCVFTLAEGFEILGTATLQIGMTAAATYTTNAPTWDVTISGYEY